MKIVLIGPTYPFRGGISHYTTLLYRALKKNNQVVFYTFKKQYPKFLFPGKTDKDKSKFPIIEEGACPIISPLNPMTWFVLLRKIMRYHPEVIVISWWVVFWAPAFFSIAAASRAILGIKVIFICHNVIEHETSSINRWFTRLVLSMGNSFIVHSREDAKNLKAMLPKAKVQVAYHPLYSAFNTGEIPVRETKKQTGVSSPVLLFFGFVRKYKGLRYLLEAMPVILKEIDVTLLVVGEFWRRKTKYIDLITKLGLKKNVKIIDRYVPNEDIPLYFSRSDLVVLPYISGTGSGILQLAYAFNKPVVATSVGSLPEIVQDGVTGYIVPPAEPEALAAAIIRVFREDRIAEFSKNISRERSKFSWDNITKAIESEK